MNRLIHRIPFLFLSAGLAGCGSIPGAGPDTARADSSAIASASSQQELPGTGQDPENIESIESTRSGVRSFSHWLGETVNDWFGDKPFSEGGSVTKGKLGLRMLWREDEGLDTNVRFRARFNLPNLRDKAYIFLGQENENELVSDQPDTFSREQQLLPQERRADQTGFFGLGFELRDYVDFRVGVRGGYKLYSQVRYQREWMLAARDRVEFRETLFWRVHDGFGSTTSIDYEHAYTPSLSLRWQNAATVTEDTDGFAWSTSVGMFKTFGDNKILSLETLATGETAAENDVGEYGVRLKWLQPVYRDWLLGEVIVGHFWPRHDLDAERGRSWAVGAGLEMRF